MELSGRLRQIRRDKGFTQKQLEELSGVPQNTISRIEIGTIKVITTPTLIALARALGVTTDYLLGLDESEGHLQPAALVEVGA